MDAKRSQLEETLKRVGFQKDDQNLERLVLQILPSPPQKGEQGYPWMIKHWGLLRVKGAWYTEQLEIELNRAFFVKSFEDLIKSKFDNVTIVELEDDVSGFWVLTEFETATLQTARQQEEPADFGIGNYDRGVYGFHASLLVENQTISVNFSNHFAFGAADQRIYREMPLLVAEALGFPPLTWKRSLFEISLDFKDIILECSATKPNKLVFHRLFERCNPRRQFKTVFQAQKGWQIFLSSPGVTEFGLVLPPIEVMESRELAQKFQEIENAATKGNFAVARQALLKAMVEYSDSLYLLRRFAYISLLEGEPVSDPILYSMLKAESENLLFLSVGLNSAQEKKQTELALERISLIGEVLSRNMPGFEQIRVFEYVLPEILGDGWRSIDSHRAYLCYERVLERRGDTLPIIQKMMQLAKLRGDIAAEASLVKKLLNLTQDRGEMASQLIRLAQLLENRNLSEAISYAMKAWQMAPHRYVTAEYASGLLLRDAKPEKAITVLDETIRQLAGSKAKRKLAELELKVGEIWWQKLNRKDLAQERLKRSFALFSNEIDFLHRLIIAYRSMDERAQEIRIYERIFELAIQKHIKDEVFKSVTVLINYFQKENPDPGRLSHIYQTLIRNYLAKPEELFDVINLENIDIDWQQLFQSVEKQVESDKSIDAKKYYLLLGRIAVQKLGDRDLGARLYEKCITIGQVEPQIYEFLEEYYAKKKDHKNRARILKIQLKGASGQERVALLHQLFYASETIDDPEVDHYALRLLLEDQDPEPIKRRFSMYQSENMLAAISRLLAALLDELKDNFSKIYWLEYVLEILHECDSEARFDIIQKNLQLLEVLHEDDVAIYEKGVRYHQDNPDPRHLAVYLDRLISRNVPPVIDPQIVLRTLSDDRASKGLYLLHLARQQDKEINRFQNLQKSLAILVNFDEYRATVIEIYSELGEISLLKVNELEDFYRYCEKADKLSVFTRALIGQLKKLPPGTLDLELFNFVLSFLKNHQFEAELIVPVLIMGIDDLEFSLQNRLKLELFLTLPKKSQFFDAEFGFQFLNEEENWDLSPRFKSIFTWLMNHEANHYRLKQIAQDMLRRLSETGDKKKVARLVEFLKQHGIATRQGSWMAFEHFVSQGIIQKSLEQWWEILRLITDVHDLRNLISETRFLLNGLNTSNQVEDYISYVVDEKLDSSLEEAIRYELRLEYALGLFMTEKHPEISHEILNQHFKKDPEDSRSWIPLFFLQSSLENKYELYDLLKFIIPRISLNMDLLKQYPVTIESLEKEFLKVAKLLHLPEDIPGYQKSTGYEREGLSETERKLKAQSRLAASRIERTEFEMRVADESQSQINAEEMIEEFGFVKQEKTQISDFKKVAGEPGFPSIRESTKITEAPPPPPPSNAMVGRPQIREIPLPEQAKTEAPPAQVNWRLIGASLLAESGASESILNQEFDSLLEQHFALQVVALIEGQLTALEKWQYKVWRNSEHYFYQPEKRLQPGEGIVLLGLKQPIAQALLAMRKILEAAFQHRYTLRGLAESLDIKIDEFIRQRVHIAFTDHLIMSSGLKFYQNEWNQKSYRIFHLKGIGDEVYYEFQQKVFYLDLDIYSSRPAHYLFHSLLQANKSMEKGYLKLTRLAPEEDLLPIFQQLIAQLRQEGSLSEGEITLEGQSYPLSMLSPVDLALLEHELASLRSLSVQDIKNALDDFHGQIMLDCLFETLDLVGIIEHFFKADLWQDDQLGSRIIRDRLIRSLLVHASKFNF